MKMVTVLLILFGVLLTGYGLLYIWGMPLIWQGIFILAVVALGGWLLALPFAWGIKKIRINFWLWAGVAVLAGLFLLPTAMLLQRQPPLQTTSPIRTLLFSLPPLTLALTAVLFCLGLKHTYETTPDNLGSQPGRITGKPGLFAFALGVLLLAKTFHNLYWLIAWDNTDDPLEYFWLVVPILAVFFSSSAISMALQGRLKFTGVLYALFVPALLIIMANVAIQVDFREVTRERAGQIAEAVEAYHARSGEYPQTIADATPWYRISFPKPMVIYGQTWCYESGADYYRLGYVDREHWSDPRLIGRIYKAKGEVPDLHRMCEAEVTAIQKHDPGYPYTYWKESE